MLVLSRYYVNINSKNPIGSYKWLDFILCLIKIYVDVAVCYVGLDNPLSCVRKRRKNSNLLVGVC